MLIASNCGDSCSTLGKMNRYGRHNINLHTSLCMGIVFFFYVKILRREQIKKKTNFTVLDIVGKTIVMRGI
jgi:hypothetical protein